MNVTKAIYCFQVFLIGLGLMVTSSIFASGGAPSHGDVMQFPVSEVSYLEMEARHAEEAGHVIGLIERLKIRAAADPFNIVATVIFFLAVFHTFLASQVPAFSPDVFVMDHWISKTGLSLANAQGLEFAVVSGAVTGVDSP